MEDPEEFFSYWASETFVKSHSIGSVYRPDGVGVPCVSSSADVLITLTVYNPKNFPFVMPTSSEPEGIIEFKELSEQPKEERTMNWNKPVPARLSSPINLLFYKNMNKVQAA